ncbi:MAG TPA: ABC transporter substrate-binding protein [Casimicrobiaceae bacterium]|nr:ABC transporter substrate-binding protein [Casimicrobiaceae bacterium]
MIKGLHRLRTLARAGVTTAGLAAVVFAGNASPAFAQLNVICPVQAEWCTLAATEFERETGIKVAMTLKGSGESLAQIVAEKANPKLDVWFGGTGDPHLQAAEQGLLEEYRSPMLKDLQPWARKQAEQSKYRTVGMYLGVLGIGYNTELLAKKNATAPACWRDLIKPEFGNDVQMANPNASGTAYTAIATLVQVFGEDEAFRYLKSLHKNINNYPRSGVGPIKAAARGETLASVSFIHDVVTEAQAGFPVKAAAPCEGTGYEIGSLSIVKGARNLENAKKFYDWALTPKAQALGARAKQFQLPSNVATPVSPLSPKVSEIKLIDYDFAKYGTTAERKRLLERWDREVGSQAK